MLDTGYYKILKLSKFYLCVQFFELVISHEIFQKFYVLDRIRNGINLE